MVPKVALDIMSCEVIRLLQLTDSSIVPISYQVPRKVREEDLPPPLICKDSVGSQYVHLMCCFSSSNLARSFMKSSSQTRLAPLRPCLRRSGGREETSR